tara:strand:- start:1339 stop:1938 length:600 start_codon:yes stop_codon:yes gene_type:complete
MADQEVFYAEQESTAEAPAEKPVVAKKTRKKRVNKPMTDEARAAMLLRLKKGREKALANRQKNAALKKERKKKAEKIVKKLEEDAENAFDEKLEKALKKPKKSTTIKIEKVIEPVIPKRTDTGEIMNKLNELQSQINSLKEEKRIRRIEKSEARKLLIEKQRQEKEEKKKKVEPEPQPEPEPVVEKPITRRSTFNRPIW